MLGLLGGRPRAVLLCSSCAPSSPLSPFYAYLGRRASAFWRALSSACAASSSVDFSRAGLSGGSCAMLQILDR